MILSFIVYHIGPTGHCTTSFHWSMREILPKSHFSVRIASGIVLSRVENHIPLHVQSIPRHWMAIHCKLAPDDPLQIRKRFAFLFCVCELGERLQLTIIIIFFFCCICVVYIYSDHFSTITLMLTITELLGSKAVHFRLKLKHQGLRR